jgi:hypothetical protein
MKLTIKNPYKIMGQKLPYHEFVVCDVVETAEYYTFLCREENGNGGQITNVRLNRDGIKEGSEWKFRYWQAPGYNVSQVTTDWFGDMENAVYSIAQELKKLIQII